MAQSKFPVQELIKNTFCPQVAVITSPNVDRTCKKNNLTFCELFLPYNKLTTDTYLNDNAGETFTIQKLKIMLREVNYRSPSAVGEKLLSDGVKQTVAPTMPIHSRGNEIKVPRHVPWYENWREIFLNIQPPYEHEFVKQFIGTLLVISSADTDLVESAQSLMNQLDQLQQSNDNAGPKWISPDAFRFYVVLHDNIEGSEVSPSTLDDRLGTMRQFLGIGNCYLLKINSRPENLAKPMLPDPWAHYANYYVGNNFGSGSSPEDSPPRNDFEFLPELDTEEQHPFHPLSPVVEVVPPPTPEPVNRFDSTADHGMYLTSEDIELLKMFINEFTITILVPYASGLINIYSDLAVQRRGVSRSILNATKRWFVSKPGSSTSGHTMYADDTPEVQMRKLGDLYFMFLHYNKAFHTYNELKKDLRTDQAWLYYAGVLEMAGYAAFMLNCMDKRVFQYLDESIFTYHVNCRAMTLALRGIILNTECMKSRSMLNETIDCLLTITGEESDLTAALLLEQVAYCFINMKPPKSLKYGLNMVLSGHRFTKAGQLEHALRCYGQAEEIYKRTLWNDCSTHVYYSLSKLSSQLGQIEYALQAFFVLIKTCGAQPVNQQIMFMREFAHLYNTHLINREVPLVLPIPLIDTSKLRILVGRQPPFQSIAGKVYAMGINFETNDTAAEDIKWTRLEELIVSEINGNSPFFPQAIRPLYIDKNVMNDPIAFLNEPISFQIPITNNLLIPIQLKNISLKWNFISDDPRALTTNTVMVGLKRSFRIDGKKKENMILTITPLMTGTLCVSGISYVLCGEQPLFEIQSEQYFDLRELCIPPTNIFDSIRINVKPAMPYLEILFNNLNTYMIADQMELIEMEIHNVGTVAIDRLYFSTDTPDLFSFVTCEQEPPQFYLVQLDDINLKCLNPTKNHVKKINIPSVYLEPEESQVVNFWMKAPNVPGKTTINLIIYYENSQQITTPRVSRHRWNITTAESISITPMIADEKIGEGQHLLPLTVQVINMNSWRNNFTTEMTLTKLTFISHFWHSRNIVLYNRPLSLLPQYFCYCFLKLMRNFYYENINEYELSDLKDSELTYNKAANDFVRRTHQIRLDNFQTSDTVRTAPAGAVVIAWSAHISSNAGFDRIVRGQTMQTIDEVLNNLCVQKFEKFALLHNKAVRYKIRHPCIVIHDFIRKGPCDVEIHVFVENITDTPLAIAVVLRESLDFTCPSFAAANGVKHELSAYDKVDIRFKVSIWESGVFYVNKYIDIFANGALQNSHTPAAIVINGIIIH